MIIWYRIFFLPLLFLLLPKYVARMWRRKGYIRTIKNRFGFYPQILRKQEKKRIWIQAVSVGEWLAIKPLIISLIQMNYEIFITTTTSTAYQLISVDPVRKLIQFGAFPIDFYLFSQRAWKSINPDLVLLMEAEIWPEHLQQAKIRSVPVLLVNARLSDQSFYRYQRFSFFTHWCFSRLCRILASSVYDGERFNKLYEKNIVEVTGNLKFDSVIKSQYSKKCKNIRKQKICTIPSEESCVVIGASTWAREERFLIDQYQEWMLKGYAVKLILVPRHAERRQEIINLLEERSLPFIFHSSGVTTTDETAVYVVDTTGELGDFIEISDIVLIGKSFPPHRGGQTPLEAAFHGKAILYGSEMSNFKSICHDLEKIGGAVRCQNFSEASVILEKWIQYPNKAKIRGVAAKNFIRLNTGATEKTASIIDQIMQSRNNR